MGPAGPQHPDLLSRYKRRTYTFHDRQVDYARSSASGGAGGADRESADRHTPERVPLPAEPAPPRGTHDHHERSVPRQRLLQNLPVRRVRGRALAALAVVRPPRYATRAQLSAAAVR